MSRLLSLPLQEDTFSLMIIIAAAAAAAEHDEPQSRPVPSPRGAADSQSVSE